MIPATYNITDQIAGDSIDYIQFNLIDVNSNPVNLTDVTIKIQFRKGGRAGRIYKSINTTTGISWIDQALGQFVIDTFLIDWPADTYYYDIQFTYPLGEVKTYVQGKLKIIEQITV